jgi:(2Fe-2S) ferredoxin
VENQTARYRAYLCCGPNCSLKRSLHLLGLLEREVARAGLGGRVEVLPGGCMKHCESGPTLTIWPGPVYYQEVNIERLRVIVAQHFGQDRPVVEYFWVDPGAPSGPQARDRIRARTQPPTPAASTSSRPVQPPPKKRPNNRPSWRSNERDVDDFKW